MDSMRQWQDAEQLAGSGGMEQARKGYEALLDDQTFAPYAHLRLSMADQQAGNVRGATGHALQAFRKAHADAGLLEMLCKLLLRLGEVRAALACANALAQVNPSAGALAETGKMFSDRMLPDAALPLIQRAMLKGMADAPAMQYLLGLNLMYAGKLDEALGTLERSVAEDPKLASAHWALAKLGDAATRDRRIDRLRDLLKTVDEGHEDAPLLWYALFHELDRDEQRISAWGALEKGMRLRRRQVPHDDAKMDDLYAAATASIDAGVREEPQSEQDGSAIPVFVVGMPRTGTTIIEQHLCAHADVASAGELRDLAVQMRWVTQQPGPYHYDETLLRVMQAGDADLLGKRYLEHTQWCAQGRGYYADKWPENHLAIGRILRALPQARVLVVRRGAADTCFSNLKEWFATSYFYSYDMQEVARQYARFDRLMTAVEAVNSPRVAVVDYEAFVQSPTQTILDLRKTLNLPARATTGESGEQGSVATASSVQVRAGVNVRHVESWKRYATQLAPMLNALAQSGYPQS